MEKKDLQKVEGLLEDILLAIQNLSVDVSQAASDLKKIKDRT